MATSAPEAPPATAQATRDYVAYQELTIDLSDPVAVAEALKSIAGDSGKIEVLAKVGTANAISPRKALDVVGEAKELEGDYAFITPSAVNTFKGVKAATKRVVSVG